MWKRMKQIRGQSKEETKVKLYENGKQMEMEKAAESFFDTWREIYNSSENEINEIWGKEIKDILIEKFEEETSSTRGGSKSIWKWQ